MNLLSNEELIGRMNMINFTNNHFMLSKLIAGLEGLDNPMVSLGDPASEREIKETEAHIGQYLPDEYKEFVRKHNGLDCLCEYILRVGNHIQPAAYSMNNIFDFEHFDVCNPMPHHIIPFSPDGYGNHYCFDMQNNGKIIFWQHDIDYSDRVPEVVYESMLEMIREVFIDWNELNIDTPLQ